MSVSHWPHVNLKSVFSGVLKSLPTSETAGLFVFGNSYCHCNDASRTAQFEVDLAGSEGLERMKADHNSLKVFFVFPVVHCEIIASVVSRSTGC